MLTLGQKAHFETFGFLIIRQIFDIDEVSIIQREVDELFAEERDGRSAGDETKFVQPFFERKPFLSTLVYDDRIYNIGLDLLGPYFVLNQTEGRVRAGVWNIQRRCSIILPARTVNTVSQQPPGLVLPLVSINGSGVGFHRRTARSAHFPGARLPISPLRSSTAAGR